MPVNPQTPTPPKSKPMPGPLADTVMFAIPGVNRQLRDRFMGLCKMKGKTGKEVIEAFLDAFIKTDEAGKR